MSRTTCPPRRITARLTSGLVTPVRPASAAPLVDQRGRRPGHRRHRAPHRAVRRATRHRVSQDPESRCPTSRYRVEPVGVLVRSPSQERHEEDPREKRGRHESDSSPRASLVARTVLIMRFSHPRTPTACSRTARRSTRDRHAPDHIGDCPPVAVPQRADVSFACVHAATVLHPAEGPLSRSTSAEVDLDRRDLRPSPGTASGFPSLALVVVQGLPGPSTARPDPSEGKADDRGQSDTYGVLRVRPQHGPSSHRGTSAGKSSSRSRWPTGSCVLIPAT